MSPTPTFTQLTKSGVDFTTANLRSAHDQKVTIETIQGITGGKFKILDWWIPASGIKKDFKVGQTVSVAWKDGIPIYVMGHSWRKARTFVMVGNQYLLEELFQGPSSTDINKLDLYYRSWSKIKDLQLSTKKDQNGFLLTGSTHVPAVFSWGQDDSTFFVTSSGSNGSFYDIFKLSRARYQSPASTTTVKRIKTIKDNITTINIPPNVEIDTKPTTTSASSTVKNAPPWELAGTVVNTNITTNFNGVTTITFNGSVISGPPLPSIVLSTFAQYTILSTVSISTIVTTNHMSDAGEIVSQTISTTIKTTVTRTEISPSISSTPIDRFLTDSLEIVALYRRIRVVIIGKSPTGTTSVFYSIVAIRVSDTAILWTSDEYSPGALPYVTSPSVSFSSYNVNVDAKIMRWGTQKKDQIIVLVVGLRLIIGTSLINFVDKGIEYSIIMTGPAGELYSDKGIGSTSATIINGVRPDGSFIGSGVSAIVSLSEHQVSYIIYRDWWKSNSIYRKYDLRHVFINAENKLVVRNIDSQDTEAFKTQSLPVTSTTPAAEALARSISGRFSSMILFYKKLFYIRKNSGFLKASTSSPFAGDSVAGSIFAKPLELTETETIGDFSSVDLLKPIKLVGQDVIKLKQSSDSLINSFANNNSTGQSTTVYHIIKNKNVSKFKNLF